MSERHRVAFTVWQGRISPLFDAAREALVLEVAHRQEVARTTVELPGGEAVYQATQVSTLGVSAVVCGAVSRQLAAAVTGLGIRLLPFVSGDVETVLDAYLAGALPHPELGMPGCGCGRRRARPRWLAELHAETPQAAPPERPGEETAPGPRSGGEARRETGRGSGRRRRGCGGTRDRARGRS